MKLFSKIGLALAGLAVLAAAQTHAAEPDKLLPSDADVVLVVNVRQILDSPVIKKYALDQLKAGIAKDERIAKPLAAAGIDPLKDVDSILIAGPANQTGADKALIVARGRFDLDKIQTTATDVAKKTEGKLKIHKEGGLNVYEIKGDNKPGFMAFKDESTMVASANKDYTVEIASGKASGRPGKGLISALDKVNGKDSIWLALVISDEMKKAMAKNPQTAAIAPKLESVTASINLTDFLLATVLIHTSDAEAAEQVKMLVNQLKPFLAVLAQANEEAAPIVNELLQNLKVESDKKAVSISLKVTEDVVKKLNPKGKQPQ